MSLVEFHDSFTFTFNRKEKVLKSERYVIVTGQIKLDCYCLKKTEENGNRSFPRSAIRRVEGLNATKPFKYLSSHLVLNHGKTRRDDQPGENKPASGKTANRSSVSVVNKGFPNDLSQIKTD